MFLKAKLLGITIPHSPLADVAMPCGAAMVAF